MGKCVLSNDVEWERKEGKGREVSGQREGRGGLSLRDEEAERRRVRNWGCLAAGSEPAAPLGLGVEDGVMDKEQDWAAGGGHACLATQRSAVMGPPVPGNLAPSSYGMNRSS